MTLLASSQALSKSFGAQSLFSDISLGFFSEERLGLIGPNGAGKSTLLKIFAGLEEPDSGEISLRRGTLLTYLSQEERFEPSHTIEEALLSALPDSLEEAEGYLRMREILDLIEFPNPQANVIHLSGGWKKRLAVAQALIQKPDLLLMDEPTNHLDLEGILWLESILKEAPFAFVLVSHDRYFLENCTNRIIELNQCYPDGFLKVEGNYSRFLEQRADFLHAQARHEAVLSNKLRRELEWLKRGPKARTTKAQSRIDQADKLKEDVRDLKSRNAQGQTARIDFDATHRKTKKLLEVKNVEKTRDGNCLFKKLSFALSPGSCLGLLGRNGAGKSSLMHLLHGDLDADSGVIRRADGVRVVFFDQQREQLNPNQSLKQALSPAGDSVVYQGRSVHVVPWAKRFLFSPEQLGMPVSNLSGGEQARVLLANLMLQPADVLLLDEPTNNLDIPTLEILEESLEEFPGAIVLITHDRFLLDRLSDQLLALEGEGRAQFFADYAQWLQAQSSAMPTSAPKPTPAAPAAPSKKLSYEERKELNRMESKIQKAETRVETIQEKLNDPTIMSDAERLAELVSELETAQAEVDRLYERWEELEALS